MDPNNAVNIPLASLTELMNAVSRSLAVQTIYPPQPVLDKIFSALRDTQQWLANQTPNDDLVPSDHPSYGILSDGVARSRQSSTLEAIPPKVMIPSLLLFKDQSNDGTKMRAQTTSENCDKCENSASFARQAQRGLSSDSFIDDHNTMPSVSLDSFTHIATNISQVEQEEEHEEEPEAEEPEEEPRPGHKRSRQDSNTARPRKKSRQIRTPIELAQAFGMNEVSATISALRQNWDEISSSQLLDYRRLCQPSCDFADLQNDCYADMILRSGKQLNRSLLQGQINLLQTRIHFANYYRLYKAAVEDVQKKRHDSGFLLSVDKWYQQRNMTPRSIPHGRGKGKARSIVIESLVDIHLCDHGFAHSAERGTMKNKIEDWRKKGETWFEIIDRFGLGMLLLAPLEEPDSHFKFTKVELAQFLRALTARKSELDLALTAANQFMASVFNGPSDCSVDCETSSGPRTPANQRDKQDETSKHSPKTSDQKARKLPIALSPGTLLTSDGMSPILGRNVTNRSWCNSPTVFENHLTPSFEQSLTSPSFFLQELQCITAVSSENEFFQIPSAS